MLHLLALLLLPSPMKYLPNRVYVFPGEKIYKCLIHGNT